VKCFRPILLLLALALPVEAAFTLTGQWR
jgi:hypothetical protein